MLNTRPFRHPLTLPLLVNAALLVAILCVLGLRGSGVAEAQQNVAPGGGGALYVMPGQISSNQWGVWVLDVDRQTLLAYAYFGGKKELSLIAARSLRNDVQLRDFRNGTPTPVEVEDLLAGEQEP